MTTATMTTATTDAETQRRKQAELDILLQFAEELAEDPGATIGDLEDQLKRREEDLFANLDDKPFIEEMVPKIAAMRLMRSRVRCLARDLRGARLRDDESDFIPILRRTIEQVIPLQSSREWFLAGNALHCLDEEGVGSLCRDYRLVDLRLRIETPQRVALGSLICSRCAQRIGSIHPLAEIRSMELCFLDHRDVVHGIRSDGGACYGAGHKSFRFAVLFEFLHGVHVLGFGGESIREPELCETCGPGRQEPPSLTARMASRRLDVRHEKGE